MLSRLVLVGSICFAAGCSDGAEPSAVPSIPPGSSSPPTSPSISPTSPPTSPPANEVPEEVPELTMVPGTLRLIVLRPETLLGSEERTMTDFFENLDATDFRVLRDEPSEVERGALTTFFGGGEWSRPAEWAPHDVVLVLEFVEPAMLGRREQRPHSRGLRNAALWSAGEDQPAFLQQSRLSHSGGIRERLETPERVGAFLVELALGARSGS